MARHCISLPTDPRHDFYRNGVWSMRTSRAVRESQVCILTIACKTCGFPPCPNNRLVRVRVAIRVLCRPAVNTNSVLVELAAANSSKWGSQNRGEQSICSCLKPCSSCPFCAFLSRCDCRLQRSSVTKIRRQFMPDSYSRFSVAGRQRF